MNLVLYQSLLLCLIMVIINCGKSILVHEVKSTHFHLKFSPKLEGEVRTDAQGEYFD